MIVTVNVAFLGKDCYVLAVFLGEKWVKEWIGK